MSQEGRWQHPRSCQCEAQPRLLGQSPEACPSTESSGGGSHLWVQPGKGLLATHPRQRGMERVPEHFHLSLSQGSSLFIYSPLCSCFFCCAGLLTIFWYARHAVQSARKVFSKIASSPPSNLCVKVTFSVILSVTILFKSSNHLPLYTLLIPFAYIVFMLVLSAQFF